MKLRLCASSLVNSNRINAFDDAEFVRPVGRGASENSWRWPQNGWRFLFPAFLVPVILHYENLYSCGRFQHFHSCLGTIGTNSLTCCTHPAPITRISTAGNLVPDRNSRSDHAYGHSAWRRWWPGDPVLLVGKKTPKLTQRKGTNLPTIHFPVLILDSFSHCFHGISRLTQRVDPL